MTPLSEELFFTACKWDLFRPCNSPGQFLTALGPGRVNAFPTVTGAWGRRGSVSVLLEIVITAAYFNTLFQKFPRSAGQTSTREGRRIRGNDRLLEGKRNVWTEWYNRDHATGQQCNASSLNGLEIVGAWALEIESIPAWWKRDYMGTVWKLINVHWV